MAECPTLIQGTRLRATRLDTCGAPVGGFDGSIVTKGFISVSMTDNVEAGEEFKVKNASGEFCVNQRSLPQLNWIDTTIEACEVNPEFFELLTGSDLVYDDAIPTPNAVGFGTDTDTYATASFALELWTNIGRASGAACTSTGAQRWGYLLLPWLVEGTLGDIKIENGPVNFTVTTITSSGNDWGRGPYNITKTRTGVPAPLGVSLKTTRHRHLQLVSLAPPEPVCGYTELVLAS